VEQAAQFCRAQHADIIWALLDSSTLMAVAWRVARKLNLPLVVSVLDPPEHWTSELRLAAITEKAMLGEFERSLRAACRVGVISEGMQAEYRRRFGIDGILLRHGIHPSLVQPAARWPQPGRQLTIGLAGSLYGREAQATLFRVFESTGWNIAGRNVRLRILSNSFNVQVSSHANIEFLGWRSVSETIVLLSGCDLLYLPYWFEPRLRYSARLCFPTKLTAYLAAGRPVLVHAPFDSAPAQFIGRYPAGEVCGSLEPNDLLAAFTRLLDNEARYGSATAAASEAIGAELGLHVFLRRLAELIDGGGELYDAMKRQAGLTGSDRGWLPEMGRTA
jgi:glycosyltransferase involved in cell wall biosynthesis